MFHHDPTLRDLERAVAYYDSAAFVQGQIGRSAGGDQNLLSFAELDVGLFYGWTLAWIDRAPELGEATAVDAALAASERGRAQALRELIRGTRGAATAAAAPSGAGSSLPAEGRALASALGGTGVPALSYVVTQDTLLAFLVLPGRDAVVFRTAVRSDTLTSLVAAVRAGRGVQSAASRAQVDEPDAQPAPMRNAEEGRADRWRDPANRLSALLLPAELRARLPASGELVIVPGGSLNLLPFAALPLTSGA